MNFFNYHMPILLDNGRVQCLSLKFCSGDWRAADQNWSPLACLTFDRLFAECWFPLYPARSHVPKCKAPQSPLKPNLQYLLLARTVFLFFTHWVFNDKISWIYDSAGQSFRKFNGSAPSTPSLITNKTIKNGRTQHLSQPHVPSFTAIWLLKLGTVSKDAWKHHEYVLHLQRQNHSR